MKHHKSLCGAKKRHKSLYSATKSSTTMSTSTGTPGFAFTHDPLTPLDPNSNPTATTVHQLRLELYTNVRTVQTDLGNGAIGHIGILMPGRDYIALTGAVYVPPERPDITNYAGILDRGESRK
jgi:hypothetical protein